MAGNSPNLPTTEQPKASPYTEIGVSGLKVYSGYVQEEYLAELRGQRAIKVYRQMAEGDPIVRALLSAVELILRAVDWRVEPANDSPEAEQWAEFVDGLFEDTSHTFEDFIAEVLSFLVFGFSYFETVYKRRIGPDETDPMRRSKFKDGLIGLRKLAPRSQDSFLRWEMTDDGGIQGFWQIPPTGGGIVMIPIDKGLLFRTTSKKNNPEGFSVLRSAYSSWYKLKTIEEMEAIGIERELAGLPVVSIPKKYLASDASSADKALADKFEKLARDVKFNQQGGIVIPSDCFQDADGKFTSTRMVDVKLLTTAGQRSINTDPVVQRHQRNIARSALADFIMLGDQKGSYALSKNKSELFLRACEAYLNQIASPLNRYLIPRLWEMNGLDRDLMPELKPGRIAPVDLNEIGTYVQQLGAAGMPLFPDEPLETYLRDVAGLPEQSPDAAAAQAAQDEANANDTGDPDESDLGGTNFLSENPSAGGQK